LPSPQQLSAIIASKQVSMVEVHAKGPWSVLPAPFGSIPRLQNTVPVLVFLCTFEQKDSRLKRMEHSTCKSSGLRPRWFCDSGRTEIAQGAIRTS
jgi:hypothetical protein